MRRKISGRTRNQKSRNTSNDRVSRNRSRRSDIYDMNSDHTQPSYDAYAKGDPDAWAESKHPSDLWLGEEPRDEIGMPQARGDMGAVPPRPRPEFNRQDDMGDDMDPRASRRGSRKEKTNLRRKASRCIRIAKALLGAVSERIIEDQAVELMTLSDKGILSTLARIKKLKAEADEDTDVDVDDIELEDEDVDEDVSAEPSTELEDEGDILLDDTDLDVSSEPSIEQDMLDDLMGDDPDLDVELDAPVMLPEEVELPKQEYDQVLQGLFDMETGEVKAKKKATKKRPVKRLGGQIRVASQKKENLSGLWESKPDVSDVFKD